MCRRRSALSGVMLGLLLLGVMPLLHAGALAPGIAPFERTWSRTDEPVASDTVRRSWVWGPGFSAVMWEPYREAPGGYRLVQYFEKSRMEDNSYRVADPPWDVTNGLIAREMITGRLQVGDSAFVTRPPARVNVAGDPDDNAGPTYATFATVLEVPLGLPDATIVDRIDRDGAVTPDAELARYGVTAREYVEATNHRVASVFWIFMTTTGPVLEDDELVTDAIFETPFFATGYPITEAYWARVKVAGVVQDVLIQCFERRCLTYTPSNAPGWEVEMGNVGQHYYAWRYGVALPVEPPGLPGGELLDLGPAPLEDWPVGNDGQAWLWVGNQSPYEMVVQLDGPTSQTLTLPACPGCIVYPTEEEFVECLEELPTDELFLPPGNYRVSIRYTVGNVIPAAGHWTLVPDATYASCYAVISSQQQ
jgi:hypothetical protein